LTITFGGKDLFVDLAAERVTLAAEKGEERIAVEISSFVSRSAVRDLQEAVGQYDVYRALLAEQEPARVLYLAVPQRVADGIFSERLGQFIKDRLKLRLLVFHETQKERPLKWIG
jgi:hypothetical protein